MTRQGGWPATGFGQRLRQLREGTGLSQQQLAEKAGCHFMTVAKLEQGSQEPAWPLVLAFADALGVECSAFTNAAETGPETASTKRPRGRPPKATPTTPPVEELQAEEKTFHGKAERARGDQRAEANAQAEAKKGR